MKIKILKKNIESIQLQLESIQKKSSKEELEAISKNIGTSDTNIQILLLQGDIIHCQTEIISFEREQKLLELSWISQNFYVYSFLKKLLKDNMSEENFSAIFRILIKINLLSEIMIHVLNITSEDNSLYIRRFQEVFQEIIIQLNDENIKYSFEMRFMLHRHFYTPPHPEVLSKLSQVCQGKQTISCGVGRGMIELILQSIGCDITPIESVPQSELTVPLFPHGLITMSMSDFVFPKTETQLMMLFPGLSEHEGVVVDGKCKLSMTLRNFIKANDVNTTLIISLSYNTYHNPKSSCSEGTPPFHMLLNRMFWDQKCHLPYYSCINEPSVLLIKTLKPSMRRAFLQACDIVLQFSSQLLIAFESIDDINKRHVFFELVEKIEKMFVSLEPPVSEPPVSELKRIKEKETARRNMFLQNLIELKARLENSDEEIWFEFIREDIADTEQRLKDTEEKLVVINKKLQQVDK